MHPRNDTPGGRFSADGPAHAGLCWTEEEDSILRAQYRRGRTTALAATLGRSNLSVQMRAGRLGLAAPSRRSRPQVVAPPAEHVDMAELIDARREIARLRVVLAMSRGYLTEWEAGHLTGLSAEPPPWQDTASVTASPLTMWTLKQAALGMGIGRGGVVGEMDHGHLGREGGGRFSTKGAVH